MDIYDVPDVVDGDVLADWSLRCRSDTHQAGPLRKAALNFPGATFLQNTVVELFHKYAGARGKKVTVRYFLVEDTRRFIKDESLAPREIEQHIAIPIDFYILRGEVHPGVGHVQAALMRVSLGSVPRGQEDVVR